MKRVLFVDDEPMLLEGLRRMLRPQRRVWEMSFAASGADALAMMELDPYDVVVTDMRMPQMDGATLLEQVRERFPSAVRIILSGYFEKEAALRALPVAHQYLAKPCDADTLKGAIENASRTCGILPIETIRCIVGKIGNLPVLPRTSTLLTDALERPECSLDELGSIIEHDVGITAKILQLVNSAFFSQAQSVTSVKSAVSVLGLDTLKHIVLTAEIFRTFRPSVTFQGFSLDNFEAHSFLSARIAARLPASGQVSSSGTLAALLHDTGKLVLASRLPDKFECALTAAHEKDVPLFVAEAETVGVCHARIGAYLLALWGLPIQVVQAVQFHHDPRGHEKAGAGLTEMAITHIADGLAAEVSVAASGNGPSQRHGVLDMEYLEELGLTRELSDWRKLAAEEFEHLRGA